MLHAPPLTCSRHSQEEGESAFNIDLRAQVVQHTVCGEYKMATDL